MSCSYSEVGLFLNVEEGGNEARKEASKWKEENDVGKVPSMKVIAGDLRLEKEYKRVEFGIVAVERNALKTNFDSKKPEQE